MVYVSFISGLKGRESLVVHFFLVAIIYKIKTNYYLFEANEAICIREHDAFRDHLIHDWECQIDPFFRQAGHQR